MSYMRFPSYIWHDQQRVHFWIRDGADEWEESGWGHAVRESTDIATVTNARPAGVGVPRSSLATVNRSNWGSTLTTNSAFATSMPTNMAISTMLVTAVRARSCNNSGAPFRTAPATVRALTTEDQARRSG